MDVTKELSLAMLQVLDDPKGMRVVVETNIPCLDEISKTLTYLIDLSDGEGKEVYDYWHVSNYDSHTKEFATNIEVLDFFEAFPEGVITDIYAESY